jgi:hypothetical protein
MKNVAAPPAPGMSDVSKMQQGKPTNNKLTASLAVKKLKTAAVAKPNSIPIPICHNENFGVVISYIYY